jgi:hypothetical protein
MYYKDSPYGQASYPQAAYYGGGPQQHAPGARAPLLPHGYDGSGEMYGNVMETIKGYFTNPNPWVVVIAVILVVIVIAWLMSGKEGYRHY